MVGAVSRDLDCTTAGVRAASDTDEGQNDVAEIDREIPESTHDGNRRAIRSSGLGSRNLRPVRSQTAKLPGASNVRLLPGLPVTYDPPVDFVLALSGTVVGGLLVLAGQAWRQVHERDRATEDREHAQTRADAEWERRRTAHRTDEQRKFIIEAQDAQREVVRLALRTHEYRLSADYSRGRQLGADFEDEFLGALFALSAARSRIADDELSELIYAMQHDARITVTSKDDVEAEESFARIGPHVYKVDERVKLLLRTD